MNRSSDLHRDTLIGVLLVVIVLAAFAPVCNNSYEFLNLDDPDLVSANRFVRAGLTAESSLKPPSSPGLPRR